MGPKDDIPGILLAITSMNTRSPGPRLVLLEESETEISESAFTFGALKHDRHKETAKTNAKSAAQIFAKRPISLLSVILLIKASSRIYQA